MRKNIYILFAFAVLAMTIVACTKDNEGVKVQIEETLPGIEITSMGLSSQVGPFLTSDTIQVSFGGALTKSDTASFDIAWYDVPSSASTPATRIDSAHFSTWNESSKTANGNNRITTTLTPSTYPNTNTFSGNLGLKLSKLPSGNKSYTLKLYARSKDGKVATVSLSKFITMK
jgi:hypothetical protein